MLRQGIDYDSYKLSVREIVTGIAVYSVIAVMVSVLFFDSLIPCLVFTPGILVFLRKIADGKCRQRKNKLNNEFKEMLLSLVQYGGGIFIGKSVCSSLSRVGRNVSGEILYQTGNAAHNKRP